MKIIIIALLFMATCAFTARAQRSSYIFNDGSNPAIRLSLDKLPDGIWLKQVRIPRKPFANAKGDCGPVQVQLEIDPTGKVVKATSISGHALLRAVSEQYALGLVFGESPNVLRGSNFSEIIKVNAEYFYDWPDARCRKK